MGRFYLGKDAITHLTDYLKELSPRHIFLVRGKRSYESCGAAGKLNPVFSSLGCRVTEFSDFRENPQWEDVEKGLSFLEQSGASLVIGVGGGSAMDMAKLLRFFYSYEGTIDKDAYTFKRELLPFILIPTTAGTGSEATRFAVLYRGKIKYSVAHSDMLPDRAYIYPPFTYGLSPYLTACTGFDALAQAIEAYWNVNATPGSDEWALQAISLLWKNLPQVVDTPGEELRDQVVEGALRAGQAIDITRTTAGHAFSYPFTSYYGYPHGHAVALCFPFIAGHNMEGKEGLVPVLDKKEYLRKMKYLKFTLGYTGENSIADFFIDYITSLGLSFHLPAGFDPGVILGNINAARMGNNPKIITDKQAEEIVTSLTGLYS